MAITRKAFKQRLRSIVIPFDGTENTLTVWYRPEMVDEEYRRAAQVMTRNVRRREREREAIEDLEEREDREELDRQIATRENAELLMRFIVDWDVYEDDNLTEKTPLTVDTLHSFGFRTTDRIVTAVLEDLNTSPNESSGSVAPSSPASEERTPVPLRT